MESRYSRLDKGLSQSKSKRKWTLAFGILCFLIVVVNWLGVGSYDSMVENLK